MIDRMAELSQLIAAEGPEKVGRPRGQHDTAKRARRGVKKRECMDRLAARMRARGAKT